jgi:hypothetical protein
MTEMLIGLLTLFFIGSTSERGQATFHVQQKVGEEIKIFDGKVAFKIIDGKTSYYLCVNEYLRADDGTLKSAPAAELIVRTNDDKEPLIVLNRAAKTYRASATEVWAFKEFPSGIIAGFGIDKTERNGFLTTQVAENRYAYFNRLDNGGFLMRVRDRNHGDLVQSISMQAEKPRDREWFKKPYIVNVTFDISDKTPEDSLFEIPDGFKKQ